MFDLAVAYRIYPGVSRAPAYYNTDKYKLSRMCVQSFKRSLGGLRVKIWALLDGCPPEYEELFRETFHDDELVIMPLNKIGNLPSFSVQIDLLTQQTDARYVYFAEDDYFYLPDGLEKAVNFMKQNQEVDFVTLYDHPDSYYSSSRIERHLVKPSGDRYWRTASSTCLTFLTDRETLIRTQSIFRSYSRGNDDLSLWLALTQKLSLLDPRIQWATLHRLRKWVKTWMWGTFRIFFTRRHRLWVPLPTLATHMESTCLSPLIDWQGEFQQAESVGEQSTVLT